MSIISKISLGNCLLRHGRSTLLTTAQQCADGFVFGTFFLRWSVHCDIKPCKYSAWQLLPWPTTMLLLLPENRITAMAKKAKRKMLVLKYIAIFLFESMCMLVWFGSLGWWEMVFMGVRSERLGWNLPFEPRKLGSFCAETCITFGTNGLVRACEETYFFLLKYKKWSHLFGSFLELGAIGMQCMRSNDNIQTRNIRYFWYQWVEACEQTYFFMLKYKQRAHLFGNFLEVGAIDMQCMRSEHNIKKLCHERPFLALKIKWLDVFYHVCALQKDGKMQERSGYKWLVTADVESLAWDSHTEHSFVVSTLLLTWNHLPIGEILFFIQFFPF